MNRKMKPEVEAISVAPQLLFLAAGWLLAAIVAVTFAAQLG